jgi:arylsulfatase A
VGRLMEKLDALGIAERTIFIFTSDNGGLHVLESPDSPATHHGPIRAGKGFLYEGGLREPLIVRWPGVVADGSQCDSPVVLTDLVPTLLEAAGVDSARTVGPLDGVSILPELRGEPSAQRTFYWHFPNYTNQGGRPAGAIRRGAWKLVEQFEDGSAELFNLDDDLGETVNLAESEQARADELRDALRDWRKRVGARMPTPNPDFDEALHDRLYVTQDPSMLRSAATAKETAQPWREWRAAMNEATRGRRPLVTPATGDIRLHAKDARLHAQTMRYEPEPYKNVLGYWTNVDDWAEWDFDVPASGLYEVEVQQGCGAGSGGAVVAVEVGGKSLEFTVQDTGHFQQMILKLIGQVELPEGKHTLAVKPRTKPGVAVMDLRRVVLRPAP